MNRRDFLKAVVFSSFTASIYNLDQLLANDTPFDENLVAVFSDIHLHLPETTQQVVRFNQCVQKVLAMNPRPANLLIYGDIAYSSGEMESYELFKKLIRPIEEAGIKWEITMGNHDRIANFQKIFPDRVKPEPFVKDRYVNIIKLPHADFIMLDSYLKDQVRGEICVEQQEWLSETLKGYNEKPVFVGCHHPLKETQIVDILKTCPKFVAYLHGHSHYYRTPAFNDVKTICFPSVGHWGDMGFMLGNITATEATFTPFIDAYQWSKYGYVKEPEKNVEQYLKELNDNSPSFVYP